MSEEDAALTPFTRGADAYVCPAPASIRWTLATIVVELAKVLGHPLEEVPDAGSAADVLAMLDFEVPADISDSPLEDTVVSRILPPMSLADPDLALELRLATRRRLVAKKARALRTLHRLLRAPEPGLVVPFSDADTVLAALTDVRVFLAERLDQYEALPATGKRRPQILGQAYELLTWWQESLLSAMGHRVSTP